MGTIARMTILSLLAALAVAGTARAQTRQAAKPTTTAEMKVAGEASVTGKVVQSGSACLTCATPEVRFCLSPDAQPKTCSSWFVYANGAKDEVRAVYAAILTAVSANKWVTATWLTGPTASLPTLTPSQQAAVALAAAPGAGSSPALARPVMRVVLQVEK